MPIQAILGSWLAWSEEKRKSEAVSVSAGARSHSINFNLVYEVLLTSVAQPTGSRFYAPAARPLIVDPYFWSGASFLNLPHSEIGFSRLFWPTSRFRGCGAAYKRR